MLVGIAAATRASTVASMSGVGVAVGCVIASIVACRSVIGLVGSGAGTHVQASNKSITKIAARILGSPLVAKD